MAIKVNNVTVIDDSRNATVVNASANSLTYSGTNVLATAAEINQLDGLTDNVQSQLDGSAAVVGTLDRTFTSGETVSLTLSESVPTPIVSVIKEIPQTGVTSNDWDVASDGANYTLHDTAYDTTLTPSEVGFLNVVGRSSVSAHQYSLGVAFDLSTASYDNVSFSLSGQDADPASITFNTDGTKMYVAGSNNDSVYQYTLSTAFDLSTASYDNVSFSVVGQESAPYSVTFNTDGTKMYMAGEGNDSVFQYTLSTAFDISTASYDNASFDVSGQDVAPSSITFDSNGTRIYILGFGTDSVYQYSTSKEALVLGTGSFAAEDVGKRIVGNGGEAILTAADGSFEEQTAFNDDSTIAAGDWSMFALDVESADAGLTLSGLTTIIQFADVDQWSYDNISFGIGQEPSPTGIAFNNDGTKMYIIGEFQDSIYQYTLSTAFDLSTASYDNVSLLVEQEDNEPQSVAFNNSGTKMYIVGLSSGEVNQYSLSTSFDLSTASYDNVVLLQQDRDDTPRSFIFNNDGTKMYILGDEFNYVYQYTLSTAFDLSTASYDNVSFSVSNEETQPTGINFNSDGSKMYILGNATDSVHQYTLGFPFDINTASYDNLSFSVSSTAGSDPFSFVFNDDGTKMYLVGKSNSSVYQYTTADFTFFIPTSTNHTAITTASTDTEFWTDINSMTADDSVNDGSVFYAVSTDDRTTWSIIDDTEGVRNIVRDNNGTWEVNDASDYGTETWVAASENDEFYALEEAVATAGEITEGFDLSGASYDSVSFSVATEAVTPSDIEFKSDGTKMYILEGITNRDVYQYSLSTAFDITTASYDSVSFDISTQAGGGYGLFFKPDGTSFYVADVDTESIYQYNLSTAWDLSTASYASKSFSISSQSTDPRGVSFKTDGTKMFVVATGADLVFQYTLGTAWDVSTASYDSVSFSGATQESFPRYLVFSSNGTKFFIGGNTDSIYEYDLNAAWDISTASYSGNSLSVLAQEGSSNGLRFNSDGTKAFVVGFDNDTVFQYATFSTTSANRMDATQLNAVSDANHYTLSDDLDLAITLTMPDGNTNSPTSDGVSINYDANVVNQGAVLGTDYEFDAPAGDTVRITALSDENFKVKVI